MAFLLTGEVGSRFRFRLGLIRYDDEDSKSEQKQSRLNHFFGKDAEKGVQTPRCMKRRCIENVYSSDELK